MLELSASFSKLSAPFSFGAQSQYSSGVPTPDAHQASFYHSDAPSLVNAFSLGNWF